MCYRPWWVGLSIRINKTLEAALEGLVWMGHFIALQENRSNSQVLHRNWTWALFFVDHLIIGKMYIWKLSRRATHSASCLLHVSNRRDVRTKTSFNQAHNLYSLTWKQRSIQSVVLTSGATSYWVVYQRNSPHFFYRCTEAAEAEFVHAVIFCPSSSRERGFVKVDYTHPLCNWIEYENRPVSPRQ